MTDPNSAAQPAVVLERVTKTFAGRARGHADVVAVRDVDLTIAKGEFFTLLGPSGCGKTTTLRLIAGFELPDQGRILIDGRDITATPAHLRPVNTVFQSYAIFPHLNVEENVGFGLSVKGVKKADRRERVDRALELVRMTGYNDRKSSELSGGQQQRVALARALINEPSVLLLDEPLAALDLKLRKEMQLELKHMQRRLGITFILVTHDQEEALTMSDRIAIMHDGAVLQVDDPVGIYERPTTRFGADFIGEMNFLDGSVEAADAVSLKVSGGGTEIPFDGSPDLERGAHVALAFRPEAVRIEIARNKSTNGTARFAGTVEETIYIGTDRRLSVRLDTGETVAARIQNSGHGGDGLPEPGSRVAVAVDMADVRLLSD